MPFWKQPAISQVRPWRLHPFLWPTTAALQRAGRAQWWHGTGLGDGHGERWKDLHCGVGEVASDGRRFPFFDIFWVDHICLGSCKLYTEYVVIEALFLEAVYVEGGFRWFGIWVFWVSPGTLFLPKSATSKARSAKMSSSILHFHKSGHPPTHIIQKHPFHPSRIPYLSGKVGVLIELSKRYCIVFGKLDIGLGWTAWWLHKKLRRRTPPPSAGEGIFLLRGFQFPCGCISPVPYVV